MPGRVSGVSACSSASRIAILNVSIKISVIQIAIDEICINMRKIQFFNLLGDIFSSSKIINLLVFIIFALVLTATLSARYYLFQSIISDDGTSKRDIIAPKTIKVVDTFKTEQNKKEIAQKVEPILTPAEDTYIKNNYATLVKSIEQIRAKDTGYAQKKEEMNLLFDFENNTYKDFILNYLINSNDERLHSTLKKAAKTLTNVLNQGVTEKDFEKGNLATMIFRNTHFETSKGEIRVISALLEQVIVPNMVFDEAATELAKKNAINSVAPTVVKFEKGDKIVFAGEPVTRVKKDALQKAGYNVLELNTKGVIGIFALVCMGIITFLYYLLYFEKQYVTKNYLSVIALLSILMSALAAVLPSGASFYFLPFPALAVLVAIFTSPRVSINVSTILITLIALVEQMPIQPAAVFIVVCLIAAIATSKVRYSRRFDLVKIGGEIGFSMLFMIVIIYLIENSINPIGSSIMWTNALIGTVNGLLSGIIVLGIIPLLESMFKLVTPYGLAELADNNQPLLKRLQFEAPGTFAHCLMVANLCETAAEAIGADPVLARVGALYHDIGKLKRPLFFVENQTYFGIENPHTKLNPRLSKMVITAHPKDGIDLAKEYGLPAVVQNFIIQHHGDSIASYFYNQAKLEEGEDKVTEEQFRYTGPRPNMKETAILMIADSVESAARTLKEHSQEELDGMINKIIQSKLNDGQLSDSPLTLKDLKTIAAVFSKSLRAAHHQRIKYHENIIQELEEKALKKKFVAPDKIVTDEEEKIEKKIQKHYQKCENNNPEAQKENNEQEKRD